MQKKEPKSDINLIEEDVQNYIKRYSTFNRFLDWFKTSKVIKKGIIYIIVIFVLWILFLIFKNSFLSYISSNTTLFSIYSHIKFQMINKTYLGLMYVAFLGALAFVSVPVELISLYYFGNYYNPLVIITFIMLGMVFGSILNYFIGFILGKKIIVFLLKSKYDAIEQKVNDYGIWILFTFSLIPFPIGWFVIIYGSMKYSFKKIFRVLLIGQCIKYIAIYLIINYVSDKIFLL